MTSQAPRQPLLVICTPCGHVWPVAYCPIPLNMISKVTKSHCPMCFSNCRNHIEAGKHEHMEWQKNKYQRHIPKKRNNS
jgi:hypothetical protein